MPSLSNWLSSLAISLSGIVGLLTFIDIFMSNAQKIWVRKKTEDLWLWLAAQQRGRFLAPLRKTWVQVVFGIAPLEIVIGKLLWINPGIFFPLRLPKNMQDLGMVWIVSIALITIVAFSINVSVVRGITRDAANYRQILLRIFLWAFLLFDLYMIASLLYIDPIKLMVIIRVLLMAQVIFLIYLLILSILWILITYILMGIIRVSEFVVYRIATYEKGPVLAICAIAGSIGAVIKLFA